MTTNQNDIIAAMKAGASTAQAIAEIVWPFYPGGPAAAAARMQLTLERWERRPRRGVPLVREVEGRWEIVEGEAA